jgi:hypothetical protein
MQLIQYDHIMEDFPLLKIPNLHPGTNRSTGDQIATDDPKHKSIFGDPVFRRETAITDLEANTNLESSIDNTALRIDTIRITRYQHYHTYPHTRSELLP